MAKKQHPKLARVIPDSRNSAHDYFIPIEEAKRLYDTGELDWDLTNNTYMPHKPGTFPGKVA